MIIHDYNIQRVYAILTVTIRSSFLESFNPTNGTELASSVYYSLLHSRS